MKTIKLFPFQSDALARLACKDRAVLSLEQGLGKTLTALLYSNLRKSKRVLIVGPADLLNQWKDEAESLNHTANLGIHLTLIDSLEKAIEIYRTRPRGYFYVGYDFLKSTPICNRKASRKNYKPGKAARHMPSSIFKTPMLAERYQSGRICKKHGTKLTATGYCESCKRNLWTFDRTTPQGRCCPKCGNSWNGVKCFYGNCRYTREVYRPLPIYKLLKRSFDTVIVDEGQKMKNINSLQAQAVHSLQGSKRLLLTGTPIKNVLSDLFYLLHWVFGEETALFPYKLEDGFEKFKEDFCLYEQNAYSHGRGSRNGRRYLPAITNVSQLWKLLAPAVLRVPKAETGLKLVDKRIVTVDLPMSAEQAALYQWWGGQFSSWFSESHEKYSAGQITKNVFSQMIVGKLAKLKSVCTIPSSEKLNKIWKESHDPGRRLSDGITSKTVWLAETIRGDIAAGRQSVIFTTLIDHAAFLQKELSAIGIRCAIVNSTNRADRQDIIKRFKDGEYDSLICGTEAVNLGHNLENASRAYMTDFVFEASTMRQAIDRVHRLTSEHDVEVYLLVHRGTVDEEQLSVIQQKGDSADLAIDGRLTETNREKVDFIALAQRLTKSGWQSTMQGGCTQKALRAQLAAVADEDRANDEIAIRRIAAVAGNV